MKVLFFTILCFVHANHRRTFVLSFEPAPSGSLTKHATRLNVISSTVLAPLDKTDEIVTWQRRAYELFNDKKVEKATTLGTEELRTLSTRFVPSNIVASTYERLFGIPERVLLEYGYIAQRWLDGSNEWQRVGSRTRDVFVCGMGEFDLEAVHQRLVDRRRREHKEAVLWEASELFGLPTELEMLPPFLLLDGCDFDDIFHYAMAKAIHAELERCRYEGETHRWQLARALERRLLLGLANDRQPYWWVGLNSLRMEGHLPGFLVHADAGNRPRQYNSSLRDELLQRQRFQKKDYTKTKGKFQRVQSIWHLNPGDPRRSHFVKYMDHWTQKKNSDRLDELLEFSPWPLNGLSMPPEDLLQQLMVERRAVQYDHLDHLSDKSNVVRVVRTYSQLKNVMNQCPTWPTLHLPEKVKEKRSIVVAIYRDEDLVAGGEYKIRGNTLSGHEQTYETSLYSGTKFAKRIYNEYKQNIRSWLQEYGEYMDHDETTKIGRKKSKLLRWWTL